MRRKGRENAGGWRRWVDVREDFQNGSTQANAVIFDKSSTLTIWRCASLLARPNLVAIRPRNDYTRFADLWGFPKRLRLLGCLSHTLRIV